jgi:hypothetical protein
VSEILTPDERAEYDALLYDAGYDADGKPMPSHLIGPRMVNALRSAVNAQRPWAEWVLEDLLVSGALRRWRKWNKQRDVVTVAGKSYTVTKPAAIGVRRRNDQGETYFQAVLWEDLTRDELEQIIARAAKQIDSESKTIQTAKRLLKLMTRVPEAQTVAEATAAIGTSTEAFLAAA